MMQRRNFLTGLVALVGGIALDQAIPFNRVWSFPKTLRIASFDEINALSCKYIVPKMMDEVFRPSPLFYRLSVNYNAEAFSA